MAIGCKSYKGVAELAVNVVKLRVLKQRSKAAKIMS